MSASVAIATVVLADDHADILLSVAGLLRSKGFDVHCAADGGEAVALIMRHRPQMAVLDIDMPVMTGLAVARTVRASTDVSHMRLVAMTGSTEPDIEVNCRDAGFDAFCRKPFAGAMLLDALGPVGPAKNA